MQRMTVVALWMIAANLTRANLREEIIDPPANAQGRKAILDDVMTCNYAGEDCVLRTFTMPGLPR